MRHNRAVSAGEPNRIVLLRHGETEWSRAGRHTGRTDIELTAAGRIQARTAGLVLEHLALVDPLVICSPRRRALATAQLAGLTVGEISEHLAEWDYGDYEGLTTPQIHRSDPGWQLWTHGCPGGESVIGVQERADRLLNRIGGELAHRDVVLVGHGHFSRALITRWIELPLAHGARFAMPAASVAVGGHEHGQRQLAALALTTEAILTVPSPES